MVSLSAGTQEKRDGFQGQNRREECIFNFFKRHPASCEFGTCNACMQPTSLLQRTPHALASKDDLHKRT
jgi:hypothetical protein